MTRLSVSPIGPMRFAAQPQPLTRRRMLFAGTAQQTSLPAGERLRLGQALTYVINRTPWLGNWNLRRLAKNALLGPKVIYDNGHRARRSAEANLAAYAPLKAELDKRDVRLDLRGEDLPRELPGVNLRNADLRGIERSVELQGADLTGALLTGARVNTFELKGATLTDTVLDPARPIHGLSVKAIREEGFLAFDVTNISSALRSKFPPNLQNALFEDRGCEFVALGWAYKQPNHDSSEPELAADTDYQAAFFSRCEKSTAHPGLEVFPSIPQAMDSLGSRWSDSRASIFRSLVPVLIPLGPSASVSRLIKATQTIRWVDAKFWERGITRIAYRVPRYIVLSYQDEIAIRQAVTGKSR